VSEFHHPYNFIPVTGKINGESTAKTPYADIKDGKRHVRHDLWQAGTHSGRLIARIRLETPTIVGGQHEPSDGKKPARIKHYQRDNNIAIPANSLRGMIGSVAETLSQSTLRILDDKDYSVRNQPMKVDGTTLNSHEFFKKIDSDLLPWNPNRKELTPAECLFGVVSDSKGENESQARALASRVRFHDAQSITKIKPEPEVMLRVLSSPKLPCPSMYFHPKEQKQGYIPKTALNPDNHIPNGRKIYLHHPVSGKEKPWQTRREQEISHQKMKMKCKTMKVGECFYFHIDFDNLTTEELNLLIRSLHPNMTFRHRLGLGKSLGLGTVQIEIEGLFLINRLERYSLDGFLNATRYHQVFRGTCDTSTAWQSLYPVEYQALSPKAESLSDSHFYSTTTLIDTPTLKILQTVGNPAKLKPNVPVMPPLTERQGTDKERETFRWFVANEKSQTPQALPAIEADKPLPVLRKNG